MVMICMRAERVTHFYSFILLFFFCSSLLLLSTVCLFLYYVSVSYVSFGGMSLVVAGACRVHRVHRVHVYGNVFTQYCCYSVCMCFPFFHSISLLCTGGFCFMQPASGWDQWRGSQSNGVEINGCMERDHFSHPCHCIWPPLAVSITSLYTYIRVRFPSSTNTSLFDIQYCRLAEWHGPCCRCR